MPRSLYDARYYVEQVTGAEASARVILPIVFELLRPEKVVDFGCGVGAWLSVARTLGAREVLGLDGGHVGLEQLRIPRERFRAVDLEQASAIPGHDLAICLEVGEHLRSDAASGLVDALTGSADAVLFGAAIPGQRGTFHVNCRWQSWWARLFVERGFLAFDVLRAATWGHRNVEHHYAQNANLFMRREAYEVSSARERIRPVTDVQLLDVVHPAAYAYHLERRWRELEEWWQFVRGHAL